MQSFRRFNTVVGFLASGRIKLCLSRELSNNCSKFATSIPTSNSVSSVKLAYSVYEPSEQRVNESSRKMPIVLLHGLFDSRRNWDSLSKVISEKTNRKVISPDLRNHGESPHTPEFSYEYMGADMNRLMNDLRIDRAVLIGHSVGAKVLMYLALTRPESVEKLISIDIAPIRVGNRYESTLKTLRAMENVRFEGAASLSEARTVAHSQLSVAIASDKVRQHLSEYIVECTESGKYRWCVNVSSIIKNIDSLVGLADVSDESKFFGPTLFLRGTQSEGIIEEDHKDIKKFFPSAKIDSVDAGHAIHQHKPREFLDIIIPFINEMN